MWLPNPTVTINGQDYTGVSVGEVHIRRGRDTVYTQANAGHAAIELIDIGTLTRFDVGSTLEVSMLFPAIEWELLADEWAGLGATWDRAFGPLAPGFIEPVFTGTVSDWTADAVAARDQPIFRYKVQAVGPLATLNRRTIFFDGRSQENDGQRVEAALTAALGTAVVDPTIIDSGVFDIAALDAEETGYSALSLVKQTAQSAEGVIFETRDGKIGYADSDRRFSETDFLELPFASVQIGGLSVASNLADITNVVTVEFDGGAVTRTADTSIDVFGEQDTRLSTSLALEATAEAFADLFLERHSTPSISLGRLSFNLRNLDPDIREQLLQANTNRGIVLTGLPARLGFLTFTGFVEGLDLRFSEYAAEIGLLVSDLVLSTGDTRWTVVPLTLQWDDVDPTLEWQNARSL
jgi:hypothetical protein